MARQTVLPGWWWAADSTAQACRWFMFSGPPMWTWTWTLVLQKRSIRRFVITEKALVGRGLLRDYEPSDGAF